MFSLFHIRFNCVAVYCSCGSLLPSKCKGKHSQSKWLYFGNAEHLLRLWQWVSVPWLFYTFTFQHSFFFLLLSLPLTFSQLLPPLLLIPNAHTHLLKNDQQMWTELFPSSKISCDRRMAGKRTGLDIQAGGVKGVMMGDCWRNRLEVEEGIAWWDLEK